MADLAQEQLWQNELQRQTNTARRSDVRPEITNPTPRQASLAAEGASPRSLDYRAAGLRARLLALRDRGEGKSIVDRLVASNAAIQAGQQGMRLAYAQLWEAAQEGAEDISLAPPFLWAIIFGPLAVGLLVARIGAIFMNGFGEIGFRGFSVPRVPPMTLPRGPIHAGKTVLIGLWTGLLYLVIGIVFYFATNPVEAAKAAFCNAIPVFCQNNTTTQTTTTTPTAGSSGSSSAGSTSSDSTSSSSKNGE